MIGIDRIYHLTGEGEDYPILVDGIWPRGIRKDEKHNPAVVLKEAIEQL